jgi:hypothetical protein
MACFASCHLSLEFRMTSQQRLCRPLYRNGPESPGLQPGDEWPQLDRQHALCFNSVMRKTYKYRLYPTKEQRRLLDQQLEECRWLSNRLLEERKTAWEQRQASVRLYDQHALLPAFKAERPTLARVQSQVLQNVAVRIDLAFKAFFRRVKAGEAPGHPRFRGIGRYDSFTFPQVPVGCHLDAEAKRLRVMNIGLVKVVLHRPLEGAPKTATIQRNSTGKWYACFSCACAESPPLPGTGQHVGLDVGLSVFAVPAPMWKTPLQTRASSATMNRHSPVRSVASPTPRRAHPSGPHDGTWWPAFTSALPGAVATSPTSTAAGWSTPLM